MKPDAFCWFLPTPFLKRVIRNARNSSQEFSCGNAKIAGGNSRNKEDGSIAGKKVRGENPEKLENSWPCPVPILLQLLSGLFIAILLIGCNMKSFGNFPFVPSTFDPRCLVKSCQIFGGGHRASGIAGTAKHRTWGWNYKRYTCCLALFRERVMEESNHTIIRVFP